MKYVLATLLRPVRSLRVSIPNPVNDRLSTLDGVAASREVVELVGSRQRRPDPRRVPAATDDDDDDDASDGGRDDDSDDDDDWDEPDIQRRLNGRRIARVSTRRRLKSIFTLTTHYFFRRPVEPTYFAVVDLVRTRDSDAAKWQLGRVRFVAAISCRQIVAGWTALVLICTVVWTLKRARCWSLLTDAQKYRDCGEQ